MHHRARSPVARSPAVVREFASTTTSSASSVFSSTAASQRQPRVDRSDSRSPSRKASRTRSSVLIYLSSNILQWLLVMVLIAGILLLGSLWLGSEAVQEPWALRDAACPDYRAYSTRRHSPISEGPLKLPYQRPVPECRTYRSRAVETVITAMKDRLSHDPDLARLFENCFPNTLDTTVRWHIPGKAPQTFVVTGDINAEWIRDSTNQLSPYIPLIKKDEGLRQLILGAIHTQAEFLTSSPYCNAFQPPPQSNLQPSSNDQSDVVNPPYDPALVFECKYELDSLASFLDLANKYYASSGDASFVNQDPFFVEALLNVIAVLDEQSLTTYDSDGRDLKSRYTFQRQTNVGTETLALGGAGNPTNLNTSLIRSAFRPSDDATIFQFFIPANAFIAVELKKLKILLSSAGHNELADQVFERGTRIEQGVWDHGVFQHREFGKVFAYEVDGYGGVNSMDDANLPSLLSLPILGFVDKDNEIYQNTRRMVMSKSGNPYYLKGPEFAGIGGPHIGVRYAWPMSLLTLIRTSDDDEEITSALKLVKSTTGGLGLMHESVNVRRSRDYTRSWFAWCNAEFAKAILDLAKRKPYLVFGEDGVAYSIEEEEIEK
ncbi:uncharacterized protein V1516DRAFT_343505 [Lipomyces oligophaga]|uniref:uncharacterized protein n=1 Tax=Lipomyces oligophaga TaxID=45792 RepID=UPI0034CD2708